MYILKFNFLLYYLWRFHAGTIYYRKSSKAEEILHSPRRRSVADGAPAVASQRKDENIIGDLLSVAASKAQYPVCCLFYAVLTIVHVYGH